MPLLPVENIPKHRLVQELNAMGLDPSGSRSELITRLHMSGLYNIHSNIPPKKTELKLFNHTNILLGSAANVSKDTDNTFMIHNIKENEPLLTGDFKTNTIELPKLVHLRESLVNSDTPGREGDIRRMGSELYMYRTTDTHEGWYPLVWGSVMVI
jgi:hypothetical protein